MNTAAKILLTAIKKKLEGKPCDPQSLPQALSLAKKHSVLNLVAEDALKAEIPDALRAKLLSYCAEYLRQQETLDYAGKLVFDKLEELKIPYMPLKGYYMKNFIPRR